ncbi:MAG: hypothetical protein R3C16_13955 [Hyphomonadaceae bacterium]
MKKSALLAALAAAMISTPAAAEGYLGLEYEAANVDTGGGDVDLDIWQGEGAFGFGGQGWGGQIDGSWGNLSVNNADADVWTLGGHLWWASDNWRLGGVVTTTQLSDGGTIDEWAAGVEGADDASPRTQFIASFTVGEVDHGGPDLDTANLDVRANFFATPNVRIGGLLGFGNLDDGATDVDTLSYGVNAEFQPWSAPVSVTLGWTAFDIDDVDVGSSTFQIGARWNFGGGTLQDRRNATPFDTTTGYYNRFYGIW